MSKSEEQRSETVYRRTGLSDSSRGLADPTSRGLIRAISPLVVGFLILLALISALGLLSVGKMDDVAYRARDLTSRNSAQLSLLLELRLAITKLDNEARNRQQAESRNELGPPFDLKLNSARDDVRDKFTNLDRPPLSDSPAWQEFKVHLQAYIAVTQNLRQYSLDGFTGFRTVNKDITDLQTALQTEQQQTFEEVQRVQTQARGSIRLWSVIALLFGALVATGTVWQVQRHFRDMRRSTLDARRERVFNNQLIEGMVSAVAAIDKEDRIRSANAAFFKLFPNASIGSSVFEKFAPEGAMKLLEAATATRVTAATYRGRWVVQVEGVDKSFDVYSSPLAIDGDQGQIITLVDATEAAEAERTLRRSESLAAVGQATTQVAHEIRNPLGSIRL
ncbi:MAG TPA: hypothetical protein VLB68_21760, partial [Pyrinomonadaceae bacterium]|nr:hypothetical protein [Pyrinomonadaceae bacterium]